MSRCVRRTGALLQQYLVRRVLRRTVFAFQPLFQLLHRPLAGVSVALDLLVPGTFCREK